MATDLFKKTKLAQEVSGFLLMLEGAVETVGVFLGNNPFRVNDNKSEEERSANEFGAK